MKTYIQLDNAVFYAHHGVMEQEKIVGNEFTVNLKIEVDLSDAIETDCIEHTISYADLLHLVGEEMSIASQLLEHVAGRIVKRIKSSYPQIEKVELKLSKRNPPMGGQIESASIIIID